MRIFHLIGGCRAIDSDDGIIELTQKTLTRNVIKIPIPSPAAAYSALQSAHLSIIGIERFTHILQVKGHYPPEWITYFRTNTNKLNYENTTLKWSQIGFSAFKSQNGVLWDIASRIANQLRLCSLRIFQISDAYFKSLSAVTIRGDYKHEEAFDDQFVWSAYAAIQTFLTDACVLRDYMAEFAARYAFNEFKIKSDSVIRTMRSLIIKTLNKITNDNQLVASLRSATSENGWLYILGAYRDLVIHSAPLISAKRKLFAVCGKISLDTQEVPAIRLPIPANPSEIQKNRASLKHFESFSEQFNEFAGSGESNSPALDGLDYCHNALGMLADLALTLAAYSPVAPEMPHFDETNIIGSVQIKHN